MALAGTITMIPLSLASKGKVSLTLGVKSQKSTASGGSESWS